MLNQLQLQYEAKFGKKVPPRYKNDAEWIQNKLVESEVPSVDPVEDVVSVTDVILSQDIVSEPIEIDIEKPEPVSIISPKPVEEKKLADVVMQTVTDHLSSSKESYQGIQAFHGFTDKEAFLSQLDKYNLNEREKIIVANYVQNKTTWPVLWNLNASLFKDWVRPIVERHWLTTIDMLSEDTLESKIYTSYLAAEKVKGENITPEIQAEILVKAKKETEIIISHNLMLKNDLQRKNQ